MGSIYVIQGLMIYIYGFDHNPPHIHVRSGDGEFTITLQTREIEGKARVRTIQIVNKFIDEHFDELNELWEKAKRKKKIEKINR